jgi:GNAT superfamily N-acetyltransferase
VQPETIVSEKEEKEFTEFLRQQLREFNNRISPHHRQSREPGAVVPLNLMLKDESGAIIGGLTGNTFWNWLEVDKFYIPEEWRGKGLGSALLKTAETIAIQRGCKYCFLSTFGFQARVFYEKQGFFVAGTLEDYPPGSAFYWMRKNL